MLLFVGVFALARFFVAAAALDTGSPFEGMGAAREVTFSALAEPALLFGMLALTRISGSLSLTGMLDLGPRRAWRRASAAIVLILASWFVVLLAENARVPVRRPEHPPRAHDDPRGDGPRPRGPAFGFILYGAALKLTRLRDAARDAPDPVPPGIGRARPRLFAARPRRVGVVVGLVESSMARLRLVRVPQLLVTATLLAGFAVVLVLR